MVFSYKSLHSLHSLHITMQLRANSSVSDYEAPFVILSFLFVGVLLLVAMTVFLFRQKAQVVIYTPRHGPMTDPADTINICIQFTPQMNLVQRFRAPSSLDLGPSALTAAPELKKDI